MAADIALVVALGLRHIGAAAAAGYVAVGATCDTGSQKGKLAEIAAI